MKTATKIFIAGFLLISTVERLVGHPSKQRAAKIISGIIFRQVSVRKYSRSGFKAFPNYVVLLYVAQSPKAQATLWLGKFQRCQNPIRRSNFSSAPENVRMVVGNNSHAIEKIVAHSLCLKGENYSVQHDLALLQLKTPIGGSYNYFQLSVPSQTGFWAPGPGGKVELAASDLGTVWVDYPKVLEPSECAERLQKEEFLAGSNVCVRYYHKNGRNRCLFDFGAPITYDSALIGILARKSEDCGDAQNGVGSFVNIALHSQWIREVTKGSIPQVDV